jgi:putative transposase
LGTDQTMKRTRFSEEQTIGVLREQKPGAKTADLCRKLGQRGDVVRPKSRLGGLHVSEARWLRTLGSENAKLKKLLAEAHLDNAALKDLLTKMVTPAARREAVVHRDVLPVFHTSAD